MTSSSQATSRDIGATIAVFITVAMIVVFALLIMDRDAGGAAEGVATEPAYTEPALPQDARYPQPSDKFAPDRIAPTPESSRGTTLLMPCQGEGLLDVTNRGGQVALAGVCVPTAYPAGKPDESEPLVPTGGGSLYASLTG